MKQKWVKIAQGEGDVKSAIPLPHQMLCRVALHPDDAILRL